MLPKIICHIMGSVDGRILTDRWTEPFGGRPKSELMGVYASIGRKLGMRAWMFGKNTLREGYFPKKFTPLSRKPEERPGVYLAPRRSERLMVVADPEADILYEASTVRGDDMAVILPEAAPAAYLEHLRMMNISYLFAGERGDDLPKAMCVLAEEFGVDSLSLQGGGVIDGAFLKAGLIDELSLVVYPGVDGCASSTSIFQCGDGDTPPAEGQRFELLSAEVMDYGVVWLRYKVHGHFFK